MSVRRASPRILQSMIYAKLFVSLFATKIGYVSYILIYDILINKRCPHSYSSDLYLSTIFFI